jgi:agmatine deiminase
MIKQSNLSNFRMPAEWEKQESTLIAWPHNKNDWPGRFENIPDVFAQIISQISKVQKVKILIQHNLVKKNIHPLLRKYKAKLKNIIFITIKTDRVWTRDSGPIYVVNKNKKILLDWKFNAWAKYKNYKYDNAINKKLNKIKNLELIKPKFKIQKKFKDIVLEGGSIDVNGKGTIITTKECLLSKVQQRNPGLKKKDIESIFNKYLGAKNTIWLNKGIAGDDTHGHIDDIARFIDTNKIFLAYEYNKKDKNFKPLDENYKILNISKDQNGKKITIIKLPMPKPIFIEKTRVPASYLNFYIANKIVLVPVFKDKNDKKVLKIFKRNFRNRKIIPIDCLDLIWGFGAIHCMTQQEPALN